MRATHYSTPWHTVGELQHGTRKLLALAHARVTVPEATTTATITVPDALCAAATTTATITRTG